VRVSLPVPDRSEQRPLGIVAQARAVEIGHEVFVEVVVTWPRVPLAALLAQPHPETAVLGVAKIRRFGHEKWG
jgi:hypothetical protein